MDKSRYWRTFNDTMIFSVGFPFAIFVVNFFLNFQIFNLPDNLFYFGFIFGIFPPIIGAFIFIRRFSEFPFESVLIKYLIMSPLAFSLFFSEIFTTINCIFPQSEVARNTTIIKMNISKSKKTGVNIYTIDISSWLPNVKSLKLGIKESDFSRLSIGKNIVLNNKIGLLGYEYFDGVISQ